ncbi:MAG: aldehyde ferredoxin oxidoreductase family protein [Candidatus Xenobiia bacterium LiM19]
MEWYGYRGKILIVDLSSGKIETEELDRDAAQRYLGGAGMNAWLLYKYLPHQAGPLDPENPLIFGAGPLTGTEFPSSARSTFTALSPLTGIFGDANGGGYFPAMVKQAGYDHIVLRGAAESPCYLNIDRTGKCTLEKADEIWGLDTVEADRALVKKHPGSMVASIGVAGEKMVRYANILSREGANSWSRTGVGAVMGSKKLKAIVANGRGKVPIAQPEGFSRFCDELSSFCASNARVRVFSRWGTMMQIGIFTSMGLLYHHNCRHQADLKYANKIGLKSFCKATEFKSKGCYRCPIKCEKEYTLKREPFAGEKGFKHELGYACAFGYNVGIDNINSVLHLTNRSNALGLDAIDASSSIATAIDLFKEGILTTADTDGMILAWNDVEMVEKLLEKTARREGFGAVLAEGVQSMEKTIGKGAEKFSLHIKGMTEPAHSCPPFLLSFAVSTRGGDHLKGMPILLTDSSSKELTKALYGGTDKGIDMYSHEDKGRVVWWHENYKTIVDSLGTCFFLTTVCLPCGRLEPAELASAYSFATGMECDGAELFRKGERAYQVERALNARRGITREDDKVKVRPEKDSWGQGIDLNHPGMLDEYYHYRGCSKDGLPLRRRLEEAGLVDIADDLEREGKLGKEETDTYLTLETLTNPLSREFTAARTKGDEFSEKIVKDKKLMELASSPVTIDLVGSVIDIKRKLKNFMKSKYGTPAVIFVGALAGLLYYLLHVKKDL